MELLNTHGYENHPFEIEAYSVEKKYGRKLLNVIKKEV
jgi:hypothetical protein